MNPLFLRRKFDYLSSFIVKWNGLGSENRRLLISRITSFMNLLSQGFQIIIESARVFAISMHSSSW
jgi:hypothetical protein